MTEMKARYREAIREVRIQEEMEREGGEGKEREEKEGRSTLSQYGSGRLGSTAGVDSNSEKKEPYT